MVSKKAQGAIEYLLIIGAAILVVAVVVVAITGVLGAGKSNVNTEPTDSTYLGLRNIIDSSYGKTKILLKFKEGENEIVFQTDFAQNLLGEVFKELPIYSKVKFEGSENCGVVDANKKETIWELENTAGYTGTNPSDASSCIVPLFSQIKVIVPEDVNMEVSEEVLEETIQLDADGDPDSIENCYDLQEMNKDLSRSYYLTKDIDCLMTENWDGGKGFEPVGNYTTPFKGNFDGAGFTISDLKINRPEEYNVGLFGYINNKYINSVDSVIEDLSLENIQIYGGSYVGGLIGSIDGNGFTKRAKINNVNVSGDIFGVDGYVGELIGKSYSVDVINSEVSGQVKSDRGNIGGIIGNASNTGILLSLSSAKVIGGGDRVGGLVGYSSNSKIDLSSYSLNFVIGNAQVGGLVGYQAPGSSIYNSYSHGVVYTSNGIGGGLVGYWGGGTINFSYSSGKVEGHVNNGGLIGNKDSSNMNVVNTSYWDVNTSTFETSAGGKGLYTYQMKNEEFYDEWDFEGTWAISPSINEGYPYLINNLPN